MKCPNCQAELLPVDGVMFCLQCGRALEPGKEDKTASPELENTSDPLLQKAITDSLGHQVKWKLPVAAATPRPVKSFASLNNALATSRPAVAVESAAAVVLPAAVPAPLTESDSVEVKHGAAALNFLPAAAVRKAKSAPWQLPWPSLGWTVGVLAAGLFIAGNLGIYSYYNDRVYPGVKVGRVDVGGVKQSDLSSYLAQRAPSTGSLSLTVDVGGAKYRLSGKGLGAPDTARAGREAINVGHNVELPLAGLITALLSKPITMQRMVDEVAVKTVASQLAEEVDHDATDPVPMIVGGQAFVISEKSGDEVNVEQAATGIAQAVGAGKTVVSVPKRDRPSVLTANAFQDDISAAQARMGLAVKISVGAISFSPSASQIGDWLVFAGAGKGVAVNQVALAQYVSGLPGKFDRKGVFDALVSALGSGAPLNYAASITKISTTPKPADSLKTWPLTTYRYCLATPGSTEASEFSGVIVTALADSAGWGLNGRVRFEAGSSNCNFTLGLVSNGSMGLLDQRCDRQSTCRLGDQIEINLANWQRPPLAWKSGTAAYRAELVNQEVGHWLGFDHAGCLGSTSSTSLLQAPTLVLDGCSPNWFAMTPDRSEKVLPGF
jgi:hypothetical protein